MKDRKCLTFSWKKTVRYFKRLVLNLEKNIQKPKLNNLPPHSTITLTTVHAIQWNLIIVQCVTKVQIKATSPITLPHKDLIVIIGTKKLSYWDPDSRNNNLKAGIILPQIIIIIIIIKVWVLSNI